MERQTVEANAVRVRVRRGWWSWPLLFGLWGMLWHARRAAGFRGARLQRTAGGVLWAVLLWERAHDARAFRQGGGHRWAMPLLQKAFDEWCAVDWTHEGASPPEWDEVHQRLRAAGRFLRVAAPSTAHLARDLKGAAPPAGRGGLRIAPRRRALLAP